MSVEPPSLEPVELEGPSLPPAIRYSPAPPAKMWLRGELPRGPRVAIVGTRKPSKGGRAFARALAKAFAQEGVAVLSGGAAGIDTAAHEGALDAGGATVVVAPSSFDHPFPEENGPLFERIVRSGGAHLTAFGAEKPVTHQFYTRNRHLAALAHALIVVEAGKKSGAHNAASAARKLGTPVFAVPGAPWERKGAGVAILLAKNLARPLYNHHSVMRLLREQNLHAVPLRRRDEPAPELPFVPAGLGSDEERVAMAAGRGPVHLDDVCRATGLDAASAQRIVLDLRLRGVLRMDLAGRFELARVR